MKKILLGLTLLTSISSFASGTEPIGELNCGVEYGGYSDFGKFGISEIDENGKRNLTVYSWNDFDGAVFENSCIQDEDHIECKFKGSVREYSVLIDLNTVIQSSHAGYRSQIRYYFTVQGTIKRTLGSVHEIGCRTRPKKLI